MDTSGYATKALGIGLAVVIGVVAVVILYEPEPDHVPCRTACMVRATTHKFEGIFDPSSKITYPVDELTLRYTIGGQVHTTNVDSPPIKDGEFFSLPINPDLNPSEWDSVALECVEDNGDECYNNNQIQID